MKYIDLESGKQENFLAIKVLTSGLMYLYLNFKFIVSLVNNFLTLFLTDLSNSLFFFTFPVIFSNKTSSAYNSQTNLAYYLAGLIEGDGNFSVLQNYKGL